MHPSNSDGPSLRRFAGIDVQTIGRGATIVLADGSSAVVIDNPRDGIWIRARYLSSPEDPDMVGREELIFVPDIVELSGANEG